ncbi:transcription elongation factor GreB [Elongatibacter sediminis]|uniref:Transcription elongation factor GreB n=1 Tax=Elongatibacter sediminis TaxID=3119006 RepID=A0AAW9RJJ9_9GAMM
MGRWRPPPEKSSPYITAEGAAALKTWLTDLWKLRRGEVVPALSAAAAEGDRSENAEYIYRKKQLGEIDRKIRYLSKRLDEIEVVDRTPPQQDRVFFGAWVGIEDEQGIAAEYRIVGADETDAARALISVDSPLARALLGRSVDDEVQVSLPEKSVLYTITSIRYERH